MNASGLQRIRTRHLMYVLVGFLIFALLMAMIPHISGMWFRAAVTGAAGGFFGVALNAISHLQRDR